MSWYLKYRPKTFEDMVSQRHITDVILAQAKQGNFSHNYLLYGPRGTGKTTTARLLAKVANCTTWKSDGSPNLDEDPASVLIDSGKTLDFVEIDAASHTGVDNIREEILDKALYQPVQLQKKVYVIDEVHMLSKGAFNALLKIMEEPPPYLLFVLATTEINRVPDTIVSRCQVFNFKRLSVDDIVGRLQYIADRESIAYEQEALSLIARLSSGAMRDAIKYLEQISLLGEVSVNTVSRFLGVVSDSVLEDFLHILAGGTFDQFNEYIDRLVEDGVDMIQFTKDLLVYIGDHFIENPEYYSKLVAVLKNIYYDSKYYPHPELFYKHSFFDFFDHNKQNESVSDIRDKSVSENDSISDIEQHQDTRSEKLQNEHFSKLGDLKEKIVGRINKKMLQSFFQKYAHLFSLEKDILTIFVINTTCYETCKKTEVSQYIENIVGDILNKKIHVEWKYVEKEECIDLLLSQ